ncbi:hypothetical protein [Bacillus coahuilensis]|uniref:hypothetical protein n=1 Tax=Bacillus coahuilensis TaxID=408580 RepID=UPI0001851467|nr:hypothetical protein [Bacillus coahuilensis]
MVPTPIAHPCLRSFFVLPKRLPSGMTVLFLLWGFAGSTFFDFTIGGGLLDYYRVNDSERYELFDLVLYFTFAPVSYFYVYIWDRLQLARHSFIPYVILWTTMGALMEWISTTTGVISYKDEYQPFYSIPIFLVVQSFTLLLYFWSKEDTDKNKSIYN